MAAIAVATMPATPTAADAAAVGAMTTACKLSTTLPTSTKIETYVFFDCEATELTGARITEVSFVAVHCDEFRRYSQKLTKLVKSGKLADKNIHHNYPRVMNKLTLAVNPMRQISLFVEDLTGLNNESLEYQPKFSEGPAITISRFLDGLKKPCCLVAHNGNGFDFPLLRKEMSSSSLEVLPTDLLSCDSLAFFRDFYSKTRLAKAADNPQDSISLEITNGALLRTPKKSSQVLNCSPYLNTPDKSPADDSSSPPCKLLAMERSSPLGEQTTLLASPTTRVASTSTPMPTPPTNEKCRRSIASWIKELEGVSRLGGDITDNSECGGICTPIESNRMEEWRNYFSNNGGSSSSKRKLLDDFQPKNNDNPTNICCKTIDNATETVANPLLKPPACKTIDNASESVASPLLKLLKPPKRYKLSELHRHVFGVDPLESHGAEIDSLVLLRTVAMFDSAFIQWSQEHAVKYSLNATSQKSTASKHQLKT